MPYHRSIPLYLETEDVFLWNLSARQCLLLGCGIALSSLSFGQGSTLLEQGLSGIWGILLFVIPAALAFVQRAGRGLEEWAVVLAHFWLMPRRFLWDQDTLREPSEQEEEAHQTEEEETLWHG